MKRISICTILALIIAISVAGSAHAWGWGVSVFVKLFNIIKVTELQTLNLGTIEKPTSTVTVHVTPGGTVGGNNDATHIDTADVKEGIFKIQGSFFATIDISASDNGNVSGMTFTGITADYDTTTNADLMAGITNQTAPTWFGTNLDLGAELEVDNTVTEGDYEPGFTLSVNYN